MTSDLIIYYSFLIYLIMLYNHISYDILVSPILYFLLCPRYLYLILYDFMILSYVIFLSSTSSQYFGWIFNKLIRWGKGVIWCAWASLLKKSRKILFLVQMDLSIRFEQIILQVYYIYHSVSSMYIFLIIR